MAFEDAIPPEYSYFLVKTAGDLTYRQIVFLAHFASDREPLPDVFPPDKEFLEHVRGEGSAAGAEVIDLGVKGLLVVSGGGQAGNLSATFDSQAIAHFRTGMLKPTKLARDLYRLMRLDTVPAEEIEVLFEELTGRRAE